MVKPFFQPDDGHLYQISDGASADFHVVGLGFQPGAVTHRARRLSAVTAEHDAVLYLVLVLLDHLEKVVNGNPFVFGPVAVGGQSVPKLVFLLLGQFVVRLEDREVVLSSTPAEFLFPRAHLLAVPADHAAVIDGEVGVGNHQVFVNADDLAEALTLRTGTDRGVE